mmetsp:Transcript_6570/g.19796  ORF Transcript_6570/g.19796 Transcript_6570/m.19796 type:complete len:249 (+) Transcript_6570:1406-2152(+)
MCGCKSRFYRSVDALVAVHSASPSLAGGRFPRRSGATPRPTRLGSSRGLPRAACAPLDSGPPSPVRCLASRCCSSAFRPACGKPSARSSARSSAYRSLGSRCCSGASSGSSASSAGARTPSGRMASSASALLNRERSALLRPCVAAPRRFSSARSCTTPSLGSSVSSRAGAPFGEACGATASRTSPGPASCPSRSTSNRTSSGCSPAILARSSCSSAPFSPRRPPEGSCDEPGACARCACCACSACSN